MITEEIKQDLFALQDTEYQMFQQKSVPNIPKESIIGVRTAGLRELAGKYEKHPEIDIFLKTLPHTYYEENMVHVFILSRWKDYDKCVSYVEKFLPYMNNWATCDQPTMKSFNKNLPDLEKRIAVWIASKETYTIRFAIVSLMKYYLGDIFSKKHLEWVAQVQNEDYYVKMAVAWYFATALAKQYDATISYLEKHILDADIHKKTIQKAIESYRISDEVKSYLRTLK